MVALDIFKLLFQCVSCPLMSRTLTPVSCGHSRPCSALEVCSKLEGLSNKSSSRKTGSSRSKTNSQEQDERSLCQLQLTIVDLTGEAVEFLLVLIEKLFKKVSMHTSANAPMLPLETESNYLENNAEQQAKGIKREQGEKNEESEEGRVEELGLYDGTREEAQE